MEYKVDSKISILFVDVRFNSYHSRYPLPLEDIPKSVKDTLYTYVYEYAKRSNIVPPSESQIRFKILDNNRIYISFDANNAIPVTSYAIDDDNILSLKKNIIIFRSLNKESFKHNGDKYNINIYKVSVDVESKPITDLVL